MFRLSGLVLALVMGLAAVGVAHGQTPTTLFSFDGNHGEYPSDDLTLSGSTLYGTTDMGGANGDGTVFSLPVTGGTPTVLYSFADADYDSPGDLTLSGSTLYGATYRGGANGDGTVFSLPVTGDASTTLCSFDGTDGQYAYGALTLIGRTLYGMTLSGGATATARSSASPPRAVPPTTLYSFDGTHGAMPFGSLTLSADGSTFYGMTSLGGANSKGTVFSIPVTGGTPTTLFSFDGAHGSAPGSDLTLSGSTLYGTTFSGGTYNDGTIFSIPVTGGIPTVLYSFDGADQGPIAGLTLSGSTLYGMTPGIGANNDGTIFSMPVTGGTPTVLFSFDGTHGENPQGSLTLSGSTLYGMAENGGADGYGTIFALTVPEPSAAALLLASAACLLAFAWRRRPFRIVACLAALALVFPASLSQAQVSNVFNMPNGEASLQFVTVGDQNNPPDYTNSSYPGVFGSVPYVYDMGKYDVTVGQYCQFLNAVAATDTYGLYNSGMAYGSFPTVGISQSGSPGNYTYFVSYNSAAWSTYSTNYHGLYPSPLAAAADCPIAYVSWGDAARFCNWLQNGQPTGGEGVGTTETGAYTLDGDTTNYMETRNTGATYFIPSENEWYKAAYYNPRNGTYWTYPTQSNSLPSNAYRPLVRTTPTTSVR